MKWLTAFLIVCLIAFSMPLAAPAQVVTSDGDGEQADSSGGSESSNFSYVLLAAVVLVVVAAGVYAGSSKSEIADAKKSPVLLFAKSDAEDNLVYEADDVISAGLAFHADF